MNSIQLVATPNSSTSIDERGHESLHERRPERRPELRQDTGAELPANLSANLSDELTTTAALSHRPQDNSKDISIATKIRQSFKKGWCVITGKPLEPKQVKEAVRSELNTKQPTSPETSRSNRILTLRSEGAKPIDVRSKLITPLPKPQPQVQYDRSRIEERAILHEVFLRIHPANRDGLPIDHPDAPLESRHNQPLMDIMIKKVKAERAAFDVLSRHFGSMKVLHLNTALVDEFNRLLISAASAKKNPVQHKCIDLDVGNYFMAALALALAHVNEHRKGEPSETSLRMMDVSLDQLLTASTKRSMHEAIERFNSSAGDGNSPLRRLHLSPWEPHASEAIRGLRDLRFHSTPFNAIVPHQRWRMCVDPVKADAMRDLQGVSSMDDHNELNGFLFDLAQGAANKAEIEKGYLNKMAKGWLLAMNTNAAVNADFVIALNDTCYGRFTKTGQVSSHDDGHERTQSFQLRQGYTVSKEGTFELKDFCAEVKELHGIHIDFSPSLAGAQTSTLTRQRHGQSFKPLMAEWINDYNNSCKVADTTDRKLAAAIVLCQRLVRLHPFPGGNCRTTAILLLNRLLVDLQEPLTMLDDPHKLAGLSVEELVALTREGQERVKQWVTVRT